MDAVDYLATVKALIIANPRIRTWTILREEIQGDIGLHRFRIVWEDDSLLEMFERFEISDGVCKITKYSFHWQDAQGLLLKRWDNAAHHPEVDTHPHHLHENSDDSVLPHEPVTAATILERVTDLLVST
jgi:hypothetical protein